MKIKRFLSIALTLAMLIGMLPGMSLTASAAGSTTEITPSNTSGTMTITLTIAAASVKAAPKANTLTYSGSSQTLTTVGEAGVGTMQYQLGESATTAPTGTWGTNVPQGTDAKDYYVWYRSYVSDNNCSQPACVTVTINQASIANATVTLSDISLVYTGSEQSVTVSSVKLGEATLAANTDYEVTSGTTGTAKNTYTVTVTGKGNYKDTATAQWSIGLATPTIVTVPAASSITYGQTLANSNLTGGVAKLGDTTVEGMYTWKNKETKPAVSDSETTVYDVVFTPADTDNYAKVECKVKLTVNKATPTVTAPTAKTLTYNGSAQELVNGGSVTGGTMKYAVTTGNTAPTDESAYTTSIPTATNAGTYYVWYKVKGDGNHSDSEVDSVTVTISNKTAQTITASDITLSYKDKDKKITATTDGGGNLSYSVADNACIEVSTTGVITPKSAGKAEVTITAAETSSYGKAEKKITVTVMKSIADCTGTLEKATYEYDGNNKTQKVLSVKDENKTLTENTDYEVVSAESTLSAKDAGVYYVVIKGLGVYTDTQKLTWKIVEQGKTTVESKVTSTESVKVDGSTSVDVAVETKVKNEDSVSKTEVLGLTTDLAVGLLSDEDKQNIQAKTSEANVKVEVYLDVSALAEASVPSEEKTAIENKVSGASKVEYLDLSLFKEVTIGDQSTGTSTVHEVKTALTVKIEVPRSFPTVASGYNRTYYVVRVHDGQAEILDVTASGGVLSFQTDKFSTYALAYKDTKTSSGGGSVTPAPTTTYYTVSFNANGHGTAPASQSVVNGSKATKPTDPVAEGYTFGGWYKEASCTNAYDFATAVTGNVTLYAKWTDDDKNAPTVTPPGTPETKTDSTVSYVTVTKVSNSGKGIVLKWNKIKGAQGYDIYMTYCGDKYPNAPTASVKKNNGSVTIKKINGASINQKKQYKFYIRAYKMDDGKKVYISKSLDGHGVGYKNNKYTDAKKIKLKKTSYSIKVGKTQKIKASTVRQNKKKKLLAHTAEFRYRSSNKEIATVSSSGKITAKKKGKCTIYVFAVNGLTKKVTITVK